MIAAYYKRLTSSDQVFLQLIFTKDHYNDLVSLQLILQSINLQDWFLLSHNSSGSATGCRQGVVSVGDGDQQAYSRLGLY